MSKPLTSMDIMDIYAKGIMKEKKEYTKSYGAYEFKDIQETKKSDVFIYTDDIDLIPTTFQIDVNFDVVFDSEKIREKYSQTGEDEPEEDEPVSTEPIPDDETEKQIQKAMSAETPGKSIRSTYVDYKSFYFNTISKELSPFAIENKLNGLIKSGVLAMPDFKIDNVTDSTDSDVKQIFKSFVNKDQKNRQPSPISVRYGYSIIFVAKNTKRKYTEDDCIETAKEFVPSFEELMLKKTDLYDFRKEQKKQPKPKQQVAIPATPEQSPEIPK